MNQKQCKRLRRDIRNVFPDTVVRQTIWQKLGRKRVTRYALDEKGQRVAQLVEIQTGRMVNAPNTQRRIYLDTKRKYS